MGHSIFYPHHPYGGDDSDRARISLKQILKGIKIIRARSRCTMIPTGPKFNFHNSDRADETDVTFWA